jgi:cytochrome d ubiquinol oxidase subunit I
MGFSGWVATLAGWYVTEIGRQPFIIYGLLRTAEVASNVPASKIAFTLTAYLLIYSFLLIAYIGVLRHLAEKTVTQPASDLPADAAIEKGV